MVAIGDIVEVRQFPGQRWAAIGPHVHGVPPGRLWRVRRDGAEVGRGRPPQGRTVGDGDLRVLSHPQFTPGQIVGIMVVRPKSCVMTVTPCACVIASSPARPRSADRQDLARAYRAIGETDIDRGDLVAQNL